jgi:hypothetical protein
MRLALKSEPVSPTGSISSVGILNQLGRPKLDALAVLIRETVQNSWDARISDERALSFRVHGWELLHTQRQVLTQQVFSARPTSEKPFEYSYSVEWRCKPIQEPPNRNRASVAQKKALHQ